TRSWCGPSTTASATPSSSSISPIVPRSCSTRSRCGWSGFAEKAQLEDGAARAVAIAGGDGAAEPLHRRVTEGEPEPAALSGSGGGEEGLEEPGQRVGGNPAAVILHFDHHGAVHHAAGDPHVRGAGA